jgi:4-hydroxybenzoate polyprenyltransferase
LGYSYTKRFTAWCHLVLGVGLSLAPIRAYLAVTGCFDILPLLFSFAVITWVSGFDIIYALQDEEFDRANRLFSIPSRWGKVRALRFSEGLHVVTAVVLALAGWLGVFSWLYWVGWGLFTAMLAYQHSIVSPADLRRVNVAFMTANGLASIFFAAITISDILKVNHFLP